MRAARPCWRPGAPRPADIGLLASLGSPGVRVARRPRVAILATGDELVDVGEPLGPGQIVNSNVYTLAAAVEEAGAEPIHIGIVRDRPALIRAAFAEALTADVVLSTGGVSVGSFDYVRPMLAELGYEERFWKVAQKPGKPLTFGRCGRTPVFGLPGNPVSSLVCFYLYAAPALRTMMGLEPRTPGDRRGDARRRGAQGAGADGVRALPPRRPTGGLRGAFHRHAELGGTAPCRSARRSSSGRRRRRAWRPARACASCSSAATPSARRRSDGRDRVVPARRAGLGHSPACAGPTAAPGRRDGAAPARPARHSDGDAVLHAVADALLGALAAGTSASTSPDTDSRWRDADSAALLAEVVRLVACARRHGGQRRRQHPRRAAQACSAPAQMRARLATVLGVEADRVGIKARTMEGLGAIGAGDAIAAQAVALGRPRLGAGRGLGAG
ncbi:MAG: 2-C-methyl-D-erythritol 2,4-cyclodiphosphate synthase [Candidatus Binatia bacterium]